MVRSTLHVALALTLVLPSAVMCAAEAKAAALRFVDIAEEIGVVAPVTFGNSQKNLYILETTGTGAAVFDYDSDGDNDIFIANGTTLEDERTDRSEPSFLYRNDGTGRFENVAAEAGLKRSGWAQGVCVGDYDNNGASDLFVAYYGPDALHRNSGDGTFVEAAANAGVVGGPQAWSAACAFLDYDKDGYLDLFVSSYVDFDLEQAPLPGSSPECKWKGVDVMCGPRGLPRALNRLYRNRGDGTFEDVSQKAGVLAPGGRYNLGVVAADFNNDSWTDVYVACDMTPSLLYRNRGDGTFEEIGSELGVAFNVDGQLQAGMGVAVADYDGNGLLDIAKTNFSGDLPSLYRNEDGEFFDDVALAAGLGVRQLLGWGIVFSDFDEDGLPDLMIANGHVYPEVDAASIGEQYRQRSLLFRNRGDGRFEDATERAGPALAIKRAARGVASGDFDGDGRPELVVVNLNGRPSVLRNEGPRANWISIRLSGTESNHDAVGTRVEVEAGGRRQIQDVMSGGSFYSHNAMELHFGLGEAETIDLVEVRWPSGQRQRIEKLRANQRYLLVEGSEPRPR